jgi:CubicO group peptidase (beta-lactamase class C family)
MIVLGWAIALSTAALAAPTDQEAVDALFAAYTKAGSPGCALGVIRDGVFIYSKGYGLASLYIVRGDEDRGTASW